MLGDCLLTVTPVALTTSGSVGSAWLTRFWTSTWAMFRSVPSSKVTVRLYPPSLVDCDDMYSMRSTPLTCCSMGAATVSATTTALAPGYWQVTWTEGGVISGYWAMGRAYRAAMTMTIEMTQAAMGRSMKNFASMAGLPFGSLGCRRCRRLGRVTAPAGG